MMQPPDYFEDIRQKASARWDQLDADRELAAPWHQLFRQVQSPRHVISELLQNADDSGATEAHVSIEDGTFIFQHNGNDFTRDDFLSLCRFGFSNKRLLHTIGFRGVGFKSTFSLGSPVFLKTPTLSVKFESGRFTEPLWVPSGSVADGLTTIAVEIEDEHRLNELERSLDEWLKSPTSLLFFKRLRSFRIREQTLAWQLIGTGPVRNSEWMVLNQDPDNQVLLVRSEPEPFPENALAEIGRERMLSVEEELDYPPSRVEIVLGTQGRLFVVLPTGVQTNLPFACNAPFIQDPARLKIKDPETSVTNRWLLRRLGELAASTMEAWLSRADLPISNRARAYDLMPDIDRDDSSLEGACATTVEKAFEVRVENRSVLLTEGGALVSNSQAVSLPAAVLQIWNAETSARLFDDRTRPPISHEIAAENRAKLINWGLVDEIDKASILQKLQFLAPPKPESWRQLLLLWAFVEPSVTRYVNRINPADLHIYPVQGSPNLLAGHNVVRLGKSRLLSSEEDWRFLAEHLLVLNQNWPRFLSKERLRCHTEQRDTGYAQVVERAHTLLEKSGFDETSDIDSIIFGAATSFFAADNVPLADAVRLAHIAAKLRAKVGQAMYYFSRDGQLHPSHEGILYHANGSLEELVPQAYADRHLLHPEYSRSFTSCTRGDWDTWAASEASGLLEFPPLERLRKSYSTRLRFEAQLTTLLDTSELMYPYSSRRRYSNQSYIIEDYDFSSELVDHWQDVENETLWSRLLLRILASRSFEWLGRTTLSLKQTSTNGASIGSVTAPPIPSRWLRRFMEAKCLPDTHGILRKPSDLLLRSAATEALMDVEHFIDRTLDTSANRKLLLSLGVRDRPLGPDALIRRLRALARLKEPPVHEVERWYIRIDQLLTSAAPETMTAVAEVFRSERLILADDGTWQTSAGIFQRNDEEIPGVLVVRPAVVDLRIWQRIDVAPRPTADHIIHWLESLESGQQLQGEDLRRVKALLPQFAERIWTECQHWLNLAGEWTPIEDLEYSLSMQSMTAWGHLFPSVKAKVADFQGLGTAVLSDPPFSALPPLADVLEERIEERAAASGHLEAVPWTKVLGMELQRFVEPGNEAETARVSAIARRLAASTWLVNADAEVTPYLKGVPAGTAKQVDVAWIGETIFVSHLTTAKRARAVPQEVGRAFGREDIRAALYYSFERAPDDIRAYIEENFHLAASAPNAVADNPVTGTGIRVPEPEVSDVSGDGIPGRPPAPEHQFEIEEQDLEDTSRPRRPRPVPPPKSRKPSVVDSYLISRGFALERDSTYVAGNTRLVKPSDGSVWWEEIGLNQEVIRFLYFLSADIENESIEIDADVWHLIERMPETRVLVLRSADSVPILISGTELITRRDNGLLKIIASRYRIVLDPQ